MAPLSFPDLELLLMLDANEGPLSIPYKVMSRCTASIIPCYLDLLFDGLDDPLPCSPCSAAGQFSRFGFVRGS